MANRQALVIDRANCSQRGTRRSPPGPFPISDGETMDPPVQCREFKGSPAMGVALPEDPGSPLARFRRNDWFSRRSVVRKARYATLRAVNAYRALPPSTGPDFGRPAAFAAAPRSSTRRRFLRLTTVLVKPFTKGRSSFIFGDAHTLLQVKQCSDWSHPLQ